MDIPELTAKEIQVKLSKKFETSDLGWRVIERKMEKSSSVIDFIRVTPYVYKAALLKRLDEVCGIAGWQDNIKIDNGGLFTTVTAGIGILLNGEWIWHYGIRPANNRNNIQTDATLALKIAMKKFNLGRSVDQFPEITIQGADIKQDIPDGYAPDGHFRVTDTVNDRDTEESFFGFALIPEVKGITKKPNQRPSDSPKSEAIAEIMRLEKTIGNMRGKFRIEPTELVDLRAKITTSRDLEKASVPALKNLIEELKKMKAGN